MADGSISLRASPAPAGDPYGVARIDHASMDEIDAFAGDAVEIRGRRGTFVRCLLLGPRDEGRGIIRIGGPVVDNAGAAAGGAVRVRKARPAPARKVRADPLSRMPPVDGRYLADTLEGIPLARGDTVRVPYFGTSLGFRVAGTEPSGGPVAVSGDTLFDIAGVAQYRPDGVRDPAQAAHWALVRATCDAARIREAIAPILRAPAQARPPPAGRPAG